MALGQNIAIFLPGAKRALGAPGDAGIIMAGEDAEGPATRSAARRTEKLHTNVPEPRPKRAKSVTSLAAPVEPAIAMGNAQDDSVGLDQTRSNEDFQQDIGVQPTHPPASAEQASARPAPVDPPIAAAIQGGEERGPAAETVAGAGHEQNVEVPEPQSSRKRAAEDEPDDPAAEPRPRKKRRSHLEVAKENVTIWTADIKKWEDKLDLLPPVDGHPPRTQKQTTTAVALERKIAEKTGMLEKEKDRVADLEDRKKKMDDALAARAAESAHTSRAAVFKVVELRLRYEREISSSANKNEAVWAKIHAKYEECIVSGELPVTDRKTVKALKAMCVHSCSCHEHGMAIVHVHCCCAQMEYTSRRVQKVQRQTPESRAPVRRGCRRCRLGP